MEKVLKNTLNKIIIATGVWRLMNQQLCQQSTRVGVEALSQGITRQSNKTMHTENLFTTFPHQRQKVIYKKVSAMKM